MKLLCLFSLVSLAVLASARADLTIVQKVEGATHGGNEMTIRVKGDKARFDLSPQISTIVDGKTGELITLMKDQKKIMRISAEQMKALGEMASKYVGGQSPNEKARLTPTGKKEMINGCEAEEYTYESAVSSKPNPNSSISPLWKGSYWICASYPNGAAILKQLQAIRSEAWANAVKGLPSYHDFPGLPVRSRVAIGNEQIITTLESVKQDPLSDDLFSVPKDYQEIKMPGIFGGKPPDKSEKPEDE